jgi:hypothetical protein
MKSTARRTGVALLAAAAAACGGSNSAPSPSAPTAPVKRLVTSGTYSAPAHLSRFITFSAAASGQLSVAISWGSASNTLWLDLSASCTSDQYVAGTCQFVYSDRTSVGVGQKTATLTALSAGTYVLIIDNRGPSDETVTYEVDLTS